MKKLIIILLLVGCSKNEKELPHSCRWALCPYKGITIQEYPKYAIADEGTDGYYLDLLHMQFPQDEYEELESKLFSEQ